MLMASGLKVFFVVAVVVKNVHFTTSGGYHEHTKIVFTTFRFIEKSSICYEPGDEYACEVEKWLLLLLLFFSFNI